MTSGPKKKDNAYSPAPSIDPGEFVAPSYNSPSGRDCEVDVVGMLAIDMYLWPPVSIDDFSF